MSDSHPETTPEVDNNSEQAADSKADLKAIAIMFGAAVLLAVHMVSGFSFDF